MKLNAREYTKQTKSLSKLFDILSARGVHVRNPVKSDCVKEHQNRDQSLRATLNLLGLLLYNVELTSNGFCM